MKHKSWTHSNAMSEEFYNRLTLGEEGNRTAPNIIGEGRSHRHAYQYSVQGNASQSTAPNSRPYRSDNRAERTEVNLHLKHRTLRRTGSDSNSRGRYRQNEQNRHILNVEGERKTHLSSSGVQYDTDERIPVSYANPNECDGTVLDGYMPEIPRTTPASKDQPIVVGEENTNARLERTTHYGGSDWNNASIGSSLGSFNCETGSFANYTQPSSKQALLCPHVKGQQSLREDNNNVPCVSFGERDDKRYNPTKHHIGNRFDRYIYHSDLERQYEYKPELSPNGPPPYYYGIQTENMMRWKNSRDKNSRQMPASSYLNEKVGKSVAKARYAPAADRNVNSSDSESGPSSSDREYWPNSYCNEKRKRRVKRKTYRPKHYLGESDPSEHSDPGHYRRNEDFHSRLYCTSPNNGDYDYDQQRSRYHLNNARRNISRSLTSVSSLDDDNNSLHSGLFTFNRISPRGKGKARISKINIKSFSTINVNPSRFNRATSSASDIGSLDAQPRLYSLENNVKKSTPRKNMKENTALTTGELSDSSLSLKKSPFNSRLVGRKSSTSGSETPKHSPIPRICSPEIVDETFKAPRASSFKTIHSPDNEAPNCYVNGLNNEQNRSVDDGTKELKSLIENLEKDVQSDDEPEELRPTLLALKTENTKDNLKLDMVSSPDSIDSPVTSGNQLLTGDNDVQIPPLSPGGTRTLFGKDTPYTIQKPFVTLANIQEQDEAVCNSDATSSLQKGKWERPRKVSVDVEDAQVIDENTDDAITSPRRRPSYVIAQHTGQMSPTNEDTARTKPNGKDQISYCDFGERTAQPLDSVPSPIQKSSKHNYEVENTIHYEAVGKSEQEQKEVNKSSDNSSNASNRRRSKKMERPRIPTILNLDDALDELIQDVNNQSNVTSNGDRSSKRAVSRQTSAPISNTTTENREPRKRSNSIDDPSSAVKLINSEADSLFMQRADGKVELRHEKIENEKQDIKKSLDMLDELVVELCEKQSDGTPSERPALSRNVDGKSAGSASDVVMSPSPSQTSINSEKSTTSGSDQIDKDVGLSPLSEIYPSRYHSDPTPRVEKDYTTIQETITEYDIKARNSNSEPAINGKLLEEAADLVKAKAAEKENNDNKMDLERTVSSPPDLPPATTVQTQKLRRRESEKARRRQAAKAAMLEANASSAEKLDDNSNVLEDGEKDVQIDDDLQTGEAGQGLLPGVDHGSWPRTKADTDANEGTPVAPTTKKKKATKSEMRWHVVQNLLETEQSYVQNLQSLVKEYLNPLRKNESIVEPTLVNEMFYQIPEILKNHEIFLEQLENRVQDWTVSSKLGDIFVSSFTKCLLMDAYSQFINHFLRARTAVRSATLAKPGFLKYCEQRARDHKEKLTLQDLMIMPVQRIPRYVLIITDLLKYTLADHPDHGNLHLALGEIKTLAERMNKGELEADQAEKEAERLRDLEASIEGITGLVSPKRKYKRQDLVAEMKGGLTKKDRCLFLFSDLLVCATVKRKQTSLRRGSLSLFSGQSAAEMNKYRLLWQYPLDDVELVTTNADIKGPMKSPEQTLRDKLELDLNTVSTISKLTESVSIPHQALDDAIRDLASDLNRLLMEQQASTNFSSFQNKVELSIGSREPIDNYVFLFLSTEIKSSWEAYFLDAKQQLSYAKDSSPNFQSAIPINKSRSGLQFTCASPTVAPRLTKRGTHCGSGDVWVASSDGCVGQVSMLSPLREFEQGMTYSPCQSRILSISPVPGWKLVGINTSNLEYDFKDNASTNNSTLRSTISKSSGYNSDENLRGSRRSVSSTSKAGREEIMAFDSSTDDDIGEDSYAASPSPPSFDGRLSPEGSSLGTAGSLDGDISSDGGDDSDFNENGSSDEERKSRRRQDKKPIERRCEDVDESDANQQPTVWMGAEDGYIYIFPVTTAIKQRRNKTKIQKAAAIQCILYVDNQVFVALANGDLCVYKRSPSSAWEINTPKTINISSNNRITCMTAILGRLWVGCQNQVVVVNTTTLDIETKFNVSSDSSRSLHAMASSGMGVWVSIQSQPIIRLYHATRFEHLCDVDTKEAVHKMLAGSDAIIKQHKSACLRVTALLTCKDLLWIGTSAGVVLTLPLPIIAPNTTSIQTPLDVTASPQGHTGHVRFLTAVEITKPDEKDESTTDTQVSSSTRRPQINIEGKPALQFPSESILIISGGDGYEDFKSNANESAGREDSTNHLLIWKV